MDGRKKAMCLGNWGIPAFSKLYISINSGINRLTKGELYWIPTDYDCNQQNSLFKEFKESKMKETKNV